VKRALLVIGGTYHPFEACAKIAAELLKSSGRYKLTVTADRDALARSLAKYDAVMIYTCGGGLTGEQEAGLVAYVRAGGGLVAIHSANAGFGENRDYLALVGSEFQTHPAEHLDVRVEVVDDAHQATTRLRDFRLTEEFYVLRNVAADVQVLATADWLGEPMPMMYARTEGKGRVFYTALGHAQPQWRCEPFQKSLLHGLDWVCGVRPKKGPIRCAMLGYGGAFNMGKLHSDCINEVAGMKAAAACDIDPARVEQAKAEFPEFKTFTNVDDLLKARGIDLVVIILPHDLHAEMALRCLRAGKHVVLEKPFCLTVREADAMIRAANQAGVMLTAFHNRRWDGDFRTIRELIRSGAIGQVFEISCGFAGYRRPGKWWRSSKAVSGGNMYDWGAHFTDWVLQLLPEKVVSVSGFFHKKVWMHVTNEDHTQAIVRFAGGAMADIVFSSISAVGRPRWRILGSRGAILDDGSVEKGCKVVTYEDGSLVTRQVPWGESDWGAFYYNVADHLLLGDELAVKPREARRVIGVIESAERSSRSGQPEVFRGG
jgi:scyllo-inositol 2-dehydrogenase (NADP+)